MNNIGIRIQEKRKELGYTQIQMADILGVSAPAVNKWEHGSSFPDITLLVPLARLLKIDVNELLGFNENDTHKVLEYSSVVENEHRDAVVEIRKSIKKCYTKLIDDLGSLRCELEAIDDIRGSSEVDEIISDIEQIFQYWDGCESIVLYDKGPMKIEMMTESVSDLFDKFSAIYKILFGKKALHESGFVGKVMNNVEKRSYCGSKASDND